MKYDYAVFIGRFQPFHFGHKAVVDKALEIANRVIVFIGSANIARSVRNPFTFGERADMISDVYPTETSSGKLIILPLNDYVYKLDGWLEEVQSKVRDVILQNSKGWTDTGVPANMYGHTVTLIGRKKDHSSYYLKLFPNWDSHDVYQEENDIINATDIRNRFFDMNVLFAKEDTLPVEVFNKLSKFRQSKTFSDIVEEYRYCQRYKDPYKGLPYEPTFNTVDAVVKCSGHILLITRRARPGKGLFALPGGFINSTETLYESCTREVREETQLGLIKNWLVDQRVFDDPYRDPRGRFITQAFYFDLGNYYTLPKVRGGDDAARAQWVPIADLRADNMFADHYFIIRHFI